ncbi:hypothetical protein FRB94_007674 [Tulasnella sp. JGI-2019a]|nr:hypothetical protein FRB93_006896 [Tulasnella sp. JGI-2019a]KAG8997427.1 hypothetical protein FRB94_007674 [Tulasnella sp. JGI-2019a]
MGCCSSRGHDPSPDAHSGIPSESIGSRDESRIRSNMSNTQNPSNTNDREMSLASRNHPPIRSPESQRVDKEDVGRKNTAGGSSQLQPRPPTDKTPPEAQIPLANLNPKHPAIENNDTSKAVAPDPPRLPEKNADASGQSGHRQNTDVNMYPGPSSPKPPAPASKPASLPVHQTPGKDPSVIPPVGASKRSSKHPSRRPSKPLPTDPEFQALPDASSSSPQDENGPAATSVMQNDTSTGTDSKSGVPAAPPTPDNVGTVEISNAQYEATAWLDLLGDGVPGRRPGRSLSPAMDPAADSQNGEAPYPDLASPSIRQDPQSSSSPGLNDHPSDPRPANQNRVSTLERKFSLQSAQSCILDGALASLLTICNSILVPGLPFAIQTAGRIVEIGQAFPKDCQELLDRISTLMIAVVAPLIAEPAERAEHQTLDRIDRLTKELTVILNDLNNLKTAMQSTVHDAQERIDRCSARLAQITQDFRTESLVQADIDRLRQYLDMEDAAHADVGTTTLSASLAEMRFLEERLKPVPARYNSSARGGVSGCLEGTRVGILQTLRDWIFSSDETQLRIFWLKGQAGAGKSAIAHTISQDCAAKGNLGASFFFSRDQADRTDGLRAFTTIAHQLAHSIPGFRAPLVTALQDEEEAYRSDISIQLEELILVPLRTVIDNALSPTVIVLDALDECEKSSDAINIVKHLANIASKLPTKCRLRILITSRPEHEAEAVIQDMVSNKAVNSRSVGKQGTKSKSKATKSASPLKLDVANLDNIPIATVNEDITRYLRNRLQDRRHIMTDIDVEPLVKVAQGLFIVASTAVRFIDDPFTPDPKGFKNQLEILLSAAARGGPDPCVDETNDAHPLDLIYSRILQRALPHWHKSHKGISKVLGAIALLFNPLPSRSLDKLLKLTDNTVTDALLPLHSVVSVPNPDEGDSAPLRVIHPSFPNFLTTPSRCTDPRFFIDSPSQHSQIALHCLNHMSESLSRDICDLGPLPTLNSSVLDLRRRLKVKVPLHLQYACSYWPIHLMRAGFTGYTDKSVQKTVAHQLVDAFGKFVRTKLLCWLEVMSLLGRLEAVVPMLQAAEWALMPLLQTAEYNLQSISSLEETLDTVKDVKRFVDHFFKPIRASAGAVYASALPLTPECRLYKQYQFELDHRLGSSPILRFGQEKGWDQVVSSSSRSVTSVAFSPNGVYIAAAFSDGTAELWAHDGLKLANLVEPVQASRSRITFPDSDHLSASSSDGTIQVYEEWGRSNATQGDKDGGPKPSVWFTPDCQQVVFRSLTGQRTWTQDLKKYPVAIAPKDAGDVQGPLQWEYPWVTYLDWRLCYLGALVWTWASWGHQITLGTRSGKVLILDFSPVIRTVHKHQTQQVSLNHPLSARDA